MTAKGNFKTEIFIPLTAEFDHEIQKQLGGFGWFSTESDGHHYYSALESSEDVNENLIWIFMLLDHHRRLFRSMTQNGVEIVCRCKWNKKRPVRLQSKALAMSHLLGISIEIY